MANNSDLNINEEPLSLKTALITGGVIVGVIAVAVGVALIFNQSRRLGVIDKYTQQTLSLVDQRPDDFAALFTVVMDECEVQLAQKKLDQQKGVFVVDDTSCLSAADHLANLGVDKLGDSSSIAYLRVKGTQYSLLEASGKYTGWRDIRNSYQLDYQNSEESFAYLTASNPQPEWRNFIQYLPGKEVAIPVKKDGQVVGFILRAVIEK